MIVSIYRVKCEGPCGRYLSDVIDAEPAMTVRPGNALAFTDPAEALEVQAQVFSAGLCPRCKDRETG